MAESQPTQTGNPAAGGDSNVEPAQGISVQANIQGNVAHVPPIDHPLVPGPGEEQRGDEKPKSTKERLHANIRQQQADRSRKSEPKKQEPKSQELLAAEAATRADYARAVKTQTPKGMGGMGRHE